MPATSKFLGLSASLLLSVALVACGDDNDNNTAITPSFEMQLLHFADMDGSDATALNSVASMSALVEQYRSANANTLVVSSGDNYIPGPRFLASDDSSLSTPTLLGEAGAGRADIAFLNAIGVQASVVGNHELDLNPGSFAGIISPDGDWPGAAFPYLSYNTNFVADSNTQPLVVANGGSAAGANGKLSGWVTVDVGGQTVGIIGASTPILPVITSVGDLTITPAQSGGTFDIDALAAAIQAGVDEMTAAGINKIVLLAHMQSISVESALASRLNDVDIIVAGGSNTRLADADDTLRSGETASDTYPLQFTSPNGAPVVVVNTDADFKYLGRFVAPFDENGVLLPGAFDSAQNGAIATTEGDDTGANAQVIAVRDALNSVLVAKDGNVLGFTSVFLEGRRAQVRNQETNLGNLSADANLWYAQQAGQNAVISLKNGGGIRAEIGQVLAPPGSTSASDVQLLPPAGDSNTGRPDNGVSQLAIETTLRFNNSLSVFDVSATELKALLEHAVAELGSQGRFPQVGGMAFSYDPAGTARAVDTNGAVTTPGERIRSLKIGADIVVQNGTIQGDPNRTFRMVSLGFLAGGGDGYPFPNPLPNLVELDAAGLAAGTATFADPGTEQDALAEYLQNQFGTPAAPFSNAEVAEDQDERIQNLSVRADTVLN